MTAELAKTFKDLHKPGSPLILANVWDVASTKALLSLNDNGSQPVKAVATASFAVAATLGLKDEELTPQQNVDAIRPISDVCAAAKIPLTVDLQDGYGELIPFFVTMSVALGAVGANIEDVRSTHNQPPGSVPDSLYPIEEQAERIKKAREAVASMCPDFVINARCDVFRPGVVGAPDTDELRMKEAIARGRAYLEAGATTVFYWGSTRGLRTEEVETLVKELDGRVAVKLASGPDALTTKELADIGVARISVGPSIFRIAMDAAKKAAMNLFEGRGLP
ncbi:phosphoenolpyruvate phosphomutase-domain-containing protein [Stachybotrys elegans]|uniref:Phosphoenolpyruvate phosphomutase-domain-containing protein n=1 Tax=Stachybotrys elegans TaxID=80388 RepID=A0A8K0WR16_9HYPO|nr:phosphoenolpyruvate phosphomutase-domain-containing protein [Stachybotrys elegans]